MATEKTAIPESDSAKKATVGGTDTVKVKEEMKADAETETEEKAFVTPIQATPQQIHNVNRGLTPDGKKHAVVKESK